MAKNRDTQQASAPQKAPISAHPAFLKIVGIWFAALFGLGIMVLPSQWVGNIPFLSSILPEGFLHLLLAALAAGLGFYAGVALARRIADKQAQARIPRLRDHRADRKASDSPVTVDQATEAASAPATGANRPLPGRRRALAAKPVDYSEDIAPVAPLPGEERAPPPPPLETLAALEIPEPNNEPVAEEAAPEVAPVEVAAAEVTAFTMPEPREPAYSPVSEQVEQPTAQQLLNAPLKDLGIVQLTERLGLAMQRRMNERPVSQFGGPEPLATAAPTPLSAMPASKYDDAMDEPIAPPPVVPEALRSFMEEPLPEPINRPAPFSFTLPHDDLDEDEDEHDGFDAASLTLPLSKIRAGYQNQSPYQSAEPSVDEDPVALPVDDQPLAEDQQVAAEPVTITPAEEIIEAGEAETAAQDPNDTERALRDALANLQRMSGAA